MKVTKSLNNNKDNTCNKRGCKTMIRKSKTKGKRNVKQKLYSCQDCDRIFTYKKAHESHKIMCKNKLMNDNNNVTKANGTNGNEIKKEKLSPASLKLKEKQLETLKSKISDNNTEEVKCKSTNEKKVAKKTESKTEYICYSCGLVCKDMIMYKEHCKSHLTRVSQHVVKKYTDMYTTPPKECPICHREQKGLKQAWLRHLDTHNSDVALHHCRVCKKGFRRADHRNKHEKRHVVSKVDGTADASDE